MEVKGKIKLINQTQNITTEFRKRDLVVTTEEQYPQDLLIQFVQEKCDVLNNFQAGDNVVIGVNLRGREWQNPQGETKYFNTIQGWRIDKDQDGGQVKTQPTNPVPPAPVNEPNDLPF